MTSKIFAEKLNITWGKVPSTNTSLSVGHDATTGNQKD